MAEDKQANAEMFEAAECVGGSALYPNAGNHETSQLGPDYPCNQVQVGYRLVRRRFEVQKKVLSMLLTTN